MWEIPLAMAFLAVNTSPETGISEALAAERSSRISNLRYELSLEVPEQRDRPLLGKARIRFDLKQPEKAVVLDFAPGAANITRANTDWKAENGHLILPPGTKDFEVEFRLGDASLNRNPDFFYSLFVPSRAHLAIPCFDQPDLKARFTVRMRVPEGWQALSNAEPGVETQPLSTYLLFFGAGKFQVETAEIGGRHGAAVVHTRAVCQRDPPRRLQAERQRAGLGCVHPDPRPAQ